MKIEHINIHADLLMGIPGRPAWWTPEDTSACAAHDRLLMLADSITVEKVELDGDVVLLPNEVEWAAYENHVDETIDLFTCRRCQFWLSMDGVWGACHGPELKCGITKAPNCCEQWTPRTE